MYSTGRWVLLVIIAPALISLFVVTSYAQASAPGAPLSSQELVRLVYQLPKHPEQRDEVVD